MTPTLPYKLYYIIPNRLSPNLFKPSFPITLILDIYSLLITLFLHHFHINKVDLRFIHSISDAVMDVCW